MSRDSYKVYEDIMKQCSRQTKSINKYCLQYGNLPFLSPILATDFSVKEASIHAPEYPTRIINTREGCLWYKEDNKFGVPKGKLYKYN